MWWKALALLTLVAAGACTGLPVPPGNNPDPWAPASRYHPESDPHPGGSMVYADWSYPTDLNPLTDTEIASRRVQVAIYAGLQYPDDHLGWVGDLAEDVPSQANGLVKLEGRGMAVTYVLRQGLQWSDGQPLTAADVVYTWHAIMQLGTAVPGFDGYSLITRVDVADDRHLTLHFAQIYPAYRTLFNHDIVPSHALAATPFAQLQQHPFWQKPTACSGPFLVNDTAPGDHITLVRNPAFARATGRRAANLDKLVFQAYPDRLTMLQAVSSGQAQLAGDLYERDAAAVLGAGGQVVTAPLLSYSQITFNMSDPNPISGQSPPWKSDPRLPRALWQDLDTAGLAAGATRGLARAASGPVLPQVPELYPASATPPRPDSAAAAAALDADGWARGADGTRSRGGARLQVQLSTYEGNPVQAAMEDAIAQAWRKLGVQVDLRNYATADYLGTWASGGVVARGQYEVGLWDWTLTPDPQSAASYLASDRIPPGAGPAPGFNYGRFQDPEIDSALSAGAATLDGPARAAAYRRLMQSYYAFGGEIPLAQRVIADVATPRLHNLRPNPDVWSTDAWNCADWWVG